MTVVATLDGGRRVALEFTVGASAVEVVDALLSYGPGSYVQTREGSWLAIDKIVMIEDAPDDFVVPTSTASRSGDEVLRKRRLQ